MWQWRGFTAFLIIIISQHCLAVTEIDCYQYAGCIGGAGSRSGQPSTNPSFGNQIRINPSAVPTEKGLGLEAIYYKGETDFSLVQGLGRVGAAISPSNSEETFFGPPGFETEEDLFDRKYYGKKYPQQKYTLAGAVNLIKKVNSGIKSRSLQLGFMGRYNTKTKSTSPGAGLNAVLGPFTLGGSIYYDETQLDSVNGSDLQGPLYQYQVKTYSLGISLGSLLIDHSVLRAEVLDSEAVSIVRLTTASLLVKRFILTYSLRSEDSVRKNFNYSTRSLETKKIKEDFFAGVQVNVTKEFLIGGLYNYYMLHEYSLTATLFF